MNFRSRTALAAIASLACLAASVQATTIGFVGAAGVNQDIPANYGSNIATSSDGWTTADGTGATPHIGLNWGNGTRWDWEFHSANTFDAIESLHAGGACR